MKRKNEKVPGFDEIIFENRNKEYGAYDLRRRYKSTECLSILGGVLVFGALVLALTFTMENEGDAKNDHVFVVVKFDPVTPDLDKIKLLEPPKPLSPVNQSKYQAPVIVEDSSARTATFAPVDAIIDSVRNGNVNDTMSVVFHPEPVVTVSQEPAVWVEEMPSFPGGEEALLKYISSNLKYPTEAAENGLQGRVTVRFAVCADGSVQKVQVLRGIHPVLDQEAIRVISGMPKWKPGRQNGTEVPVWFFVPVNFQLKCR